ncbi:hypothetical protein DI392_19260 [Vibrio albus]|uniref:Uncharacterized protein n=1 Tax=Vibrio albus TaxID=2200953 RepID=A0A2U3B302_9VIBR|nr:hypothetical protein [Vibrio albus]PWI31095.1 hypothetical protein DI392_19260 [Vibrio albus]
MTAAPNRTKMADPKNKMNEHQQKESRHRVFERLNLFQLLAIKAVSQRVNKAHFAPEKAYSRNKEQSGNYLQTERGNPLKPKRKPDLITPN